MSQPLRILLISWYFPPINDVGALRVGKLARYLTLAGDDVQVLTAERTNGDQSLELDFPPNRIFRTAWTDVDKLATPWRSFRKFGGSSGRAPNLASPPPRLSILKKFLSHHYTSLVRLPDRQVGWLPQLLQRGEALLSDQKADLIYASGPPFTTFIGASILSKRTGIPWVAEYRDGWSHYLYSQKPKWRIAIDEVMENTFTRSAQGIVAVSDLWADYYQERFSKPTAAIYNGYDEEKVAPDFTPKAEPDAPIYISYLGELYSGLRDPTVLYQAIIESGLSPLDVQVQFYGPDIAEVMSLANCMNVAAYVTVKGRVSHDQSLKVQRESDILLLLQPSEDPANVPAKTFEYFAARRPILGLGLDDGIPAKLIREREAGFYNTDANALATQLKAWVAQKRREGYIPCPPETALTGLSRSDQFSQLRNFLIQVVGREVAGKHKRLEQPGGVSSLLPDQRDCVAELGELNRPLLLVLIDAEEEFDWNKPFSRKEIGVKNIAYQHLAHRLFDKYAIKPTYAVDYPVASQKDGFAPLLDLYNSGRCEIGAQLHPWVTPPHNEYIGERNSYPGNLPRELESAKLKNLTELIETTFKVKPELYRAGRYGTGPNTAEILMDLGYKVDCSVLPTVTKNMAHSPDYRGAPSQPYWPKSGSNLLEIPVTSNSIGLLRFASSVLSRVIADERSRRMKLPAILARARIFDQIRLSPEGITISEAKRLTRFLLKTGQKVFVVSYHSPSLGLGNTPYVANHTDRTKFINWLEVYFDFFFGELNGLPATPKSVWEIAVANRDSEN